MVKGDFEGRPVFKIWLHLLLSPWATYLTPLNSSLLTCKMQVVGVPT